MSKSCGNCARVHKYTSDGLYGDAVWACDESFGAVGMPVHCTPPYDEACPNWTDNPEDVGKEEAAMRNFIDHYWDD